MVTAKRFALTLAGLLILTNGIDARTIAPAPEPQVNPNAPPQTKPPAGTQPNPGTIPTGSPTFPKPSPSASPKAAPQDAGKRTQPSTASRQPDTRQQKIQADLRRSVDDKSTRFEDLQAELARKGMSEQQRARVERARRHLELLNADIERLGQTGDNEQAFLATQMRIQDNERRLEELLTQLR